MAKYSKLKKTLISTLCVVTLTCTGLAAACSSTGNDDNSNTDPFVKRDDLQTLKNGNFEYYDYPAAKTLEDGKASYLIKTPDNWSRSGDSTGTLGGIIGTSYAEWAALTADDLETRLTANADLKSSDDAYVNYNGMRARDILYKDTYGALLESSQVANSAIKYQSFADYYGIYRTEKDGKYEYKLLSDDTVVYISDSVTESDEADETAWKNYEFYFDGEFTKPVRKALIENPGTHYNINYNETTDKYTFDNNGTTVELKVDSATGSLYYTEGEGKDAEDIFVSNVLMLHNYDNDISSTGTTNSSANNGIQQYYTSQSITLEAKTAAEISVWVKTSELRFDKGYSLLNQQDAGAYIEVVQTVSGSSIDSFTIKNINTEKIINNSEEYNYDIVESNGWLKYTIYVNSCDFASSTVQIRLGLGGSNASEKVTGYAFFDDVQVTKFLDLDDEDCTYSDNNNNNLITCSLTSDADEKTFNADVDLRNNDARESGNFYYLIDLASEIGDNVYENLPVSGGAQGNATAWLTEYKSGSKYYASALTYKGSSVGFNSVLTANNPELPKNATGRLTDNDLIGIFSYNHEFTTANFNSTGYENFKDYSSMLNEALTNEDSRLPDYDGNILVMLSSRGAAYTATVRDNAFTVPSKEYIIVSIWVKTSDMKGSTAATLKVTSLSDDDKYTTLTVDTTGKTTDIGDDEDLYKGWVECFFFIENDSNTDQQFKLDLSFGNTTIGADTAYSGGWVAFANLKKLAIDKDVYGLASAGDSLAKLSYTVDDDKKTGNEFDSASGTSDIKEGFANLANYNGLNGGSSMVSDNAYRPAYDTKNTNDLAGLLNRDYFETDAYADIKTLVENYFGSNFDATTAWARVFGDNCYQPIIIINNLRVYTELGEATKDTYSLYYVKAENGYSGDDLITVNGQNYKKATEWDEDAEYFAFAVNYGFTGASNTITSESCTTITVKVMVSGDAKAYIYLVDENKEIMHYTASGYTYWYDADGNVLDEEFDADWKKGSKTHREHIVYTLRDDGLYEDADGNVRYNLGNLIKKYDNYLFDIDKETYQFYDEQGNRLNVSNLEDNGTYFDRNGNIAPHYLANSDGVRIFEYKDGNYYYIEDGKTTNIVVKDFDSEQYKRNYEAIDKEYAVCVENTNGEWVTVSFAIKTGNESKTYSLELWSGERGESGVIVADNKSGTFNDGAVAFDYSSYSITSSNFATLSAEYEANIITRYKNLLLANGLETEIASNSENLKYYEELLDKLVSDNKISKDSVDEIRNDYAANYYAYSFYDSSSYAPIVAEERESYEYDATDSAYAETLAYFEYKSYNSDNNIESLSIFTDYSVIDKTISSNDNSTDDSGDDSTSGDNDNEANIWLYAASILLLVALLITLISIIIRKIYKKMAPRRNAKRMSKNNYRRRERYIRKLHLVKEETVEEPADETPAESAEPATEEAPAEAPAETEAPAEMETPAEAPADVTEEQPAETPAETTVETETPVETPTEAPAETETPAEAPAEAPAETVAPAETPAEAPAETEAPAEEKDSDGENKE